MAESKKGVTDIEEQEEKEISKTNWSKWGIITSLVWNFVNSIVFFLLWLGIIAVSKN